MKIQKKAKTDVKASEECALVADAAFVEPDNKSIAAEHIQSAISALSACAVENPEDAIITDSIANLGVVLLDLKSASC